MCLDFKTEESLTLRPPLRSPRKRNLHLRMCRIKDRQGAHLGAWLK